ncbi:TdeIII family type II restriction endonuclease [Vibrio atlanticus]|uniref:TdeIII family type II restriction endonuclease n=1 Tax=Vibrio atlanticus TaxID=693153 RepID=UPI003D12FC89
MLSKNDLKEIIEETISHNIDNFFDGKEVKTTHMLDHIFPRERKIRSLIGGLETSMGTRVWEPLAKEFAKKSGYDVCDEKKFNSSVPVIPDNVTTFISLWEKKKNKDPSLKLQQYWVELKEYIKGNVDLDSLEFRKIPKGEGVDVILACDSELIMFDIKTNQLNAGGGPKFLKNIMNWYAYLALKEYPGDVRCFLAFPFDPHSGKFWAKEGGKVTPLIKAEEAFVADEFWDQLTRVKGTTSIIEETFKDLGSEFGKKFSGHFE